VHRGRSSQHGCLIFQASSWTSFYCNHFQEQEHEGLPPSSVNHVKRRFVGCLQQEIVDKERERGTDGWRGERTSGIGGGR
jgi:hypothetical protein